MTVSGGPFEIWNYWRATTPPVGRVGDLWMDLSQSPPSLKICTAAGPLTFVAVTVGGATSESVTSAIATHEADTTSVHGIADTSVLATATSVATAVSNHEADTTSVHGIADTSALATKVYSDAAVTTHAGLADPHTGYQKESEKAAASGYASLGSDTLVPQDQLGTGAQDGTKFLRDDGTWQAVTATTPDMNVIRRSTSADTTVAAGYAAYVPGGFEIGVTHNLEIAATAALEIG